MKSVITTALALSLFACGHAYANVITFDQTSPATPPGTTVTSQFTGVTFSGGAEVLGLPFLPSPAANPTSSPPSLNSPTFPAASGNNVVYNSAGSTITAIFAAPQKFVGADVTGNTNVTEEFFNGATPLGSISTTGANYTGAGTGLTPNIFLSASAFSITSVEFIAASGLSNSFTLDNFTFSTSAPHAIPSPLMGAGLPGIVAACAGLFLLARHRRRHGIV